MFQHIVRLAVLSLVVFAVPATVSAQGPARGEQARLVAGVPVYVTHPDDRSNVRGWNEGWMKNEGVLADVTWPVRRLGSDTQLRAGVTAGVFDNSVFRTSVFFGGAAEVETYATEHLTLSIGTYAGAVTGYEHAVSPGLTPYVGTSYAVTDELELGLRGFWLPAKTIGGSGLAASDAYVGAITMGTRF